MILYQQSIRLVSFLSSLRRILRNDQNLHQYKVRTVQEYEKFTDLYNRTTFADKY